MQKIKRFIKHIGSLHPEKTLLSYLKIFEKSPLIIADVGSMGGIHDRWDFLRPYCKFYTFDPDPRAKSDISSVTHFPIGLWSLKQNKILQLSEFSSSSSFFEYHPNLNRFLNFSCHNIINEISISLESMANILMHHSPPNFIKIDTEGAELEILKGAESFLSTSCFGLEVEVSFLARHVGAPLYSDISIYLEKFGFELADLSTERWIKNNNVYGIGSRAQVIWADAVFFLSPDSFFHRIASLSSQQQYTNLLHFVTLLLAYNLHDSAIEILQLAQERAVFSEYKLETFIIQIKKLTPSPLKYYLCNLSLIMLGVIAMLCCAFLPFLRKKVIPFLRQKWRNVLHTLFARQRSGPYNAAAHYW